MANILHIKSLENDCWQTGMVCTETKYEDTLEPTGVYAQTIKGFGGCFNELGWDALQALSEDDRKAIMDELFNPENCNFNYGRVPIGANDFSLEWYSCDDVKDDYELEHFNIERDKTYTIPFIKEATQRQKDFFVFGSPWSPPIWMKTKPAYNFGTIRMEEKVLIAYAKYFVKFVEAYAKEGVKVKQVHVQNEPMADQKFPSCKWTGEDMRDFIKGYLGPEFEKSGLDTEIWLGTINGPFMDILMGPQTLFSEFYDQWANTVLSDKEARKYLTGVGLQWGGKHILDHITMSYPEMRIMQTESECGDSLNDWQQMEYIYGLMWQYFVHGAERYTYWNLALQDGGISTWGWKQNSLITVNPDSRTYRFQPEYYLMKHFSHFIQPGARFRPLRGHWASSALAFENPDGAIVLCACNGVGYERTLSFRCERGAFSCAIAPHTFHTFVLR